MRARALPLALPPAKLASRGRNEWLLRRLVPSSAAAVVVLLAATGARASEGYEVAGPVRAADYLPAELLKGTEWTVADEASNDGLDNSYTLESRFGPWQARGEEQVATRIGEIEALARLEEVSKTDVFLEAVKASVTAPIRLVQDAAERPKETLLGLPRGVSRWFRRTSFRARETYHDVSVRIEEERTERRERRDADGDAESEEAVAAAKAERRSELEQEVEATARKEALDYLRITSAERRWYRELGVDPYTDNELLREAVESVARVEGLTSLGMRFVGIPSLPGSRWVRDSLSLVWDTHPADLMLRNRKRMAAAGLSTETARAFEDSELTLTEQTVFLDSLDTLDSVAGREHLFALVPDLETRDEARALTSSAVLLAVLHQGDSPLAEILAGSALQVARTRAGGLAAIAPAGAVFYTEAVAEGLREFTAVHAAEPPRERRLYVTGVTSERFDNEARNLGWEVVDRWRPAPPEGTEATEATGSPEPPESPQSPESPSPPESPNPPERRD